MYYPRLIDKSLREWADRPTRKPILLRGARQVGKSCAVRHLGDSFSSFVEINFERNPEVKNIFTKNLEVRRIVRQLSAIVGQPIVPGETLLFFDEIQYCPEAIMSLRFFKEDMPELHVIAAGSLLEFALEELPTFGVGRIHSMFMYPMSFDEFLTANGEDMLMTERNEASLDTPLPSALHDRLSSLFRTYLIVGGMPEVVAKWVTEKDYLVCQEIQDDLLLSYEDDFPKYRKKVDPQLLKLTLRSIAKQTTNKFVYSDVGGGYSIHEVKKAVELLILAGLCVPVVKTSANGLPLGAESDNGVRKLMLFDTGLMLRLMAMSLESNEETSRILLEDASTLVNRGPVAEMSAGLEIIRYRSPNLRHTLFYWLREAKNSQAEIDYLTVSEGAILPIEVKAGSRGGMKSLWIFMREKSLKYAVRTSLENLGNIEYNDSEDGSTRDVLVCPLYSLSRLPRLLAELKTQ